jgi:serine/threonine protein kinase/predicted ATPase/class 3 adenylate cyclase
VGTGGMAEVFLAKTALAQGLNKILVIKKIHSAYARSSQFAVMFRDEAKIAVTLNHPNIIQVFDYGQVGDTFFLAMEFVEGMDLLRLLQEAAKAKQRLPYGLSAYIVQQLAKGLDYAHRKPDEYGQPLGIVHRDISPQNILLSWDGAVKIVDFGIARARDVHEEQGVIKGKFAYMSPEQARGEPVDCRSDVFAAGIVLFELVCARPLFHGKGKEALEMVKSGAIPRPKDYAPELPDSLERIILKALAFHRNDRFQTARDLQNELGRFLLEWGGKTGYLVDSGNIAQTLSQLMPADMRVVAPRPAFEGDAPSLNIAVPVGASDDALDDGPGDAIPKAVTGPEPSAMNVSMERPVAPLKISVPVKDLVAHSVPVPQAISSVPGSGSGESRATRDKERKYVYVLQGLLRGMTALEKRLGAQAAAKLVNDFYRVARDVAFKHEALLESPKLPGDGKDISIPEISGSMVAVTPVPGALSSTETGLRLVVGVPIASEDDAGRAIRLALALVDTLDGIGSDVEPELRLALAVQRGVALSKKSGTEVTYEIEDATAAFAHKLARQARGAEILVGGRVFRSARGEWNFESLPAIDLPSDEPLSTSASRSHVDEDTDPGVKRARVYRLRGPKARAERMKERRDPGRLHGRELELKALKDTWRDVLVTKRKRQVAIIGDAGVGKRTLVNQFLDGIGKGEAVVIRTTGRVASALTPYGVLADLARDVLGLAEDAEPHEVERRLLRAMPLIFPGEENSRQSRTALQIFSMLLGARQAAPSPEVDAETRRQALLAILNRIEQRLEGDKPIVLVGEDVHWTDEDSQQLFAALLSVPTPRPILGIMTARPEPRILKIFKELNTEMVVLDELPEENRRQLLEERFVPGIDISDLVDQIAKRAGGNAFFINELLDTLIERGIVVADTDEDEHPGLLRWVKRDAPILVPSTVEDLLVTRIDALPDAEKEALIHAAVFGRQIMPAQLAQLLGRPVRLELDELVHRGLLGETNTPDGTVRFKNDMTMTVAYQMLPNETRAQLHRVVAARISNGASYRPGQDDPEIARHLELAGDSIASADRYMRAATHAVELGGNTDGFQHLTRALKLVPTDDHERRFAIHRMREEILRRLAKRSQQLRELHALRKEAELTKDAGKLAAANCALAQFYIDVGKAPAALRAALPAQKFAETAGDQLLQAEALRLRATISRLVGNADESLTLADQALALCDAVAKGKDLSTPSSQPILVARATILNQRGTTLWNIGRLEAAIESYAEALVIYRAIGMSRHEARALNNMGIVFAALGEYEEALAHYKSALKIDQELGDRSSIALKLGNIGQCYSDLGDLDKAESYLGKALKIAEQTGDLSAAADTAVSWGQAKLQRGEIKPALALFERGLALATENRERYQEVRALQYIAYAHLITGDPAETALEMARSATDWARKMPMLVGIIYGLAFQGLALSKLGRHDEAIAAVDEAVAHLEGARPEGAEHVYRWRSQILTAAGRTADAAAALERARAEIEAKAAKIGDVELRRHYLASRERLT